MQLFEFQWLRSPQALDAQLSKAFYTETQGIHALVVRLFQLTQIIAIREGSEQITAALLRRISKERFGPVQPMLEALRSKKKKRIELYDDLLMETLAGLGEEITKNTQAARVRSAAEKRQSNTVQLNAVSALMAMGIPQTQAIKAVAEALVADPALTGEQLVKAACEQAEFESPTGEDDVPPDLQSMAEIVRGAATTSEALELLQRAGVLG